MRGFGLIVAAVTVGILLFNGTVMAVSPSRWLGLPDWIGFHGSLRRYRSTGTDGLSIRCLGLAYLTMIFWGTYRFLRGPQPDRVSARGERAAAQVPLPIALMFCCAACFYGVTMLFRPDWWFDKHFRPLLTQTQAESSERVLVMYVRFLSLPVIGSSLYFAWSILGGR